MAKSTLAKSAAANRGATTVAPSETIKSWREAVESIAIAIVLAFLFRGFLTEAFVIPTGSMAPTLQGRHRDIKCVECGYRYRAGDSEGEQGLGKVAATTCPMCFFTQQMDPDNVGHSPFSGDRILVNKFAYEAPFGDPERWDVIVFKFPGNAKQNYIKRLVGLPGETVWIQNGDIYLQQSGQSERKIARKPPAKLRHMLQLVHDTRHVSKTLQSVGWPAHWGAADAAATWSSADGGRTHECQSSPEMNWLRYRHFLLDFDDWTAVLDEAERGEKLPPDVQPRPVLITDFYAYNAQTRGQGNYYVHPAFVGSNWVGDLAVECDVEVLSDEGELELDLVEAGRHHRCHFDLSTGQASLSIDGGQLPFQDEQGRTVAEVKSPTRVRGKGRYSLRFTNADNQLCLWVNNRVCEFDGPTTYVPPTQERPVASAADPGDLAPIGLGARQAQVRVDRLRVLRDIYYIAAKSVWDPRFSRLVVTGELADPRDRRSDDMRAELTDPSQWDKPGNPFDRRQEVSFSLGPDEFFPLGDNSPQSSDGRLWGPEVSFDPQARKSTFVGNPPQAAHHVDRDMLIGKAVAIYWPHAWWYRLPLINKPIPVFPNFQRMGLIH